MASDGDQDTTPGTSKNEGAGVKKSTSAREDEDNRAGQVTQTMLLELQAPKIQLWKGNGRDLLTVKQWTESVDRVAFQRQWSPAKTASVVYDFMVDDAAKWIRNLKRGASSQYTEDWRDLKREMITRFSTVKTMAQKTRALATLTQKKDESVAAFFDRIEEVMHELGEEEQARFDDMDDPETVWRRAIQLFTKAFFVAGINKEIRADVEEKMRERMTLTELVELAREKESVRNLNPGAATAKINAIEGDEKADKEKELLKQQAAEIAALKARMNAFTAGQGAKDKKDRPPPPPMEKRDKAFFCYICHRWGIHLTRECKMTREEGKKIPQEKWEDPKKRPATIPFDPCYPNVSSGGSQ